MSSLSQQEMINSIYFNNAATSYPKPLEVFQEIKKYITDFGTGSGRSGSDELISDLFFTVRSQVKSIVKHGEPERVIFVKNATEGLNVAISGILKQGDHCVATVMDHNSVLRPLNHNRKKGIMFSLANANNEGFIDIIDIENKINTNTKLLIAPHASNVTGTIMNIDELVKIAQKHDLYLLVDSAQTAGAIPAKALNYEKMMIAITGHKALLGPQGIGCLILGKDVLPKPLIVGGTGSKSDLVTQPEFLPDYLEAGTHNGVGVAGLHGSLNFLEKRKIQTIRTHELELSKALWEGLEQIPQIKLLGPKEPKSRTGIVALTLNINILSVSDLSFILMSSFNITTRTGLLCAPLANERIGAGSEGVLRLSFGSYNTLEEVKYLISSLKTILKEKK